MNHLYEEIDEHIQWLINFMNEEYPNNYELVIDNNSGTIRSTLQAQMFLRNDLRSPEGFRKATEKPMNKFMEKFAEVAKEHYENTLCECWLSDYGNNHHYCNGTKERDTCHCGGDVKKCDFYPEKRGEKVMKKYPLPLVKTTIDMFYEMALMAFYDGHIAIYVDNKETADVLYRFCWDYPIEMDYPNGEGCGIQMDYTYKVAFVEYVNRHTDQKGTRRILLRYKGKNDACGVDILNAGNVFKED